MSDETPDDVAAWNEYRLAQQSAEHHDNIFWKVTNTLLLADAALFGVVVRWVEGGPASPDKALLVLVTVLGVWGTATALRLACGLRDIKLAKYDRCKELEVSLKLGTNAQHSRLNEKSSSECAQLGSMFDWYRSLFSLFAIAWVIVCYSGLS